MSPDANSLLSLSERIVFLALIALFGLQALRTYYRRLALINRGQSRAGACENLTTRCMRFLAYVPGQWSNLRSVTPKDPGGAVHFALFWSLLLFSVYYLLFLILGEGIGIDNSFLQSRPAQTLSYLADFLGILLIAALLFGLIRRAVVKPFRLGPDYEVSLFLFVTLAGTALLLCFYLLGALRLNLGITLQTGPITAALAGLFSPESMDLELQRNSFHVLWWLQAAIICCFLLYVPFSEHQHALFAPINILAGKIAPRQGTFQPRTMDTTYNGLKNPEDFSGKQLLELYGCAQCGRCQEVCPAVAAGKALSPKKIIQDLRVWMDDSGDIHPFWKKKKDSAGDDAPGIRVMDEEIWACNTCMACAEVCPALVSSMDKIVDLRRDRVLADAKLYPEVAGLFRTLDNFGDTFGIGSAHRENWAIDRRVKILNGDNETEYLFWVGCQTSFGDRAKSNAAHLTNLLARCGKDVAILGRQESCCGDPSRRLGNEYQFASFAKRNISMLNGLEFKKIVTYCPHCYNVLKNEYPQFGSSFEVVHYTEVLEELVQNGTLKFRKSTTARVAYHDPCYLARANDITSGNRVIDAMPGMELQPLEQSGNNTFCCGGGGGAMWMRDTGTSKVNALRAQQLGKTDPDLVVSSCPYCQIMLDDGVRSLDDETIQCRDLLEIVAETAIIEEARS